MSAKNLKLKKLYETCLTGTLIFYKDQT